MRIVILIIEILGFIANVLDMLKDIWMPKFW